MKRYEISGKWVEMMAGRLMKREIHCVTAMSSAQELELMLPRKFKKPSWEYDELLHFCDPVFEEESLRIVEAGKSGRVEMRYHIMNSDLTVQDADGGSVLVHEIVQEGYWGYFEIEEDEDINDCELILCSVDNGVGTLIVITGVLCRSKGHTMTRLAQIEMDPDTDIIEENYYVLDAEGNIIKRIS